MFFVLGLGRSGFPAARFLRECGYALQVWDDQPSVREQAQEEGFHVASPSADTTTLILSPGIFGHPFQNLIPGCEVMSDIQLFFRFFPQVQAVGITGTNGKSTTCKLIHHGLQKQKIPSVLIGNIGQSPFATLEKGELAQAIHIFELSSYQLEYCTCLPLKITVFLNVSPHHLERHGSMEQYTAIKRKIFHHAEVKIVGPSLEPKEYSWAMLPSFSLDENILEHVSLPEGLRTPHNQLNCAAAYAVLHSLGHMPTNDPFHGFEGLAHRQELIGTFCGITYLNDSKATNPQAALVALQACPAGPVYWIAGGVIQEDDLEVLLPGLYRITHAFVIGQSGTRYHSFLTQQGIAVTQCGELTHAVHSATALARAAGRTSTILFSPGCASFDAFCNFEHRGQAFQRAVKALWTQNV